MVDGATPSDVTRSSVQPVAPLAAPGTRPLKALAPAPQGITHVIRTVWMPATSYDEVQGVFLAEMLALAQIYGFKLVVQVSNRGDVKAWRQRLIEMQTTPVTNLDEHLAFISAGGSFTAWGQDNKVLTVPHPTTGRPAILYPANVPSKLFDLARAFTGYEGYHGRNPSFQGAVAIRHEGINAHAFAQRAGIHSRCTRTYLEGGNVLAGQRPNGKPYALVGRDSQVVSAFILEQRGLFTLEQVQRRIHEMQGQGRLGDAIVREALPKLRAARSRGSSWREWLCLQVTADDTRAFLAKLDLTHDCIAADLGLSRSQVCIITQPDFHLDMHMRSMQPGQVMLNDPRACAMLLENILAGERMSRQHWEFVELHDALSHATEESYSESDTVDAIASELKAFGLRCVLAPGVMRSGRRRVNFMNGVAGCTEDGQTFYFTNASTLQPLQRAFEAFVKQTTGVQHVEFVGSLAGNSYTHNMAEVSLEHAGGLNCREVHSNAAFAFC